MYEMVKKTAVSSQMLVRHSANQYFDENIIVPVEEIATKFSQYCNPYNLSKFLSELKVMTVSQLNNL